LKKYKLNKRDIIALYPLASPEKIVNDFGADRCVSTSMIRKYYRDEKLQPPMIARKELLNAIVNGEIVFDQEPRKPDDEWFDVASERVEEEYNKIKKRIMKDVHLYEERNVSD